jgi:DNA-binding NtrC family response regulator
MALPRVLVVDEDPHVVRTFDRVLGESCKLIFAHGAEEALDFLAADRFDVVVADLHLLGTRFDVLQAIERYTPGAEVIEIAGHPLRALNAGDSGRAYPRLAKPLEPALTERTVKRAIERRGLRAEVEQLRRDLEAAGIGRER